MSHSIRPTSLAGIVLLLAVLIVTGFAPFSSAVAGGKIVIKLGTLAPKDTPWYNGLARMGQEWEKVSNGKIKVKIYPGGVLGSEQAMVRKIRTGRLHAATMTSIGIREIDPAFLALQLPYLVRNYEELDTCAKALEPLVSKRLEDNGFIFLHQGDSGWIRFFTMTKIETFEQMSQQKLFVGAGDQGSIEAWQKTGFNIVQVASADITTSLQTGLLDGLITPPLAALAMQWFGQAKYMYDLKFAPLVGATVISKKIWDKIPADLHPKLKEIAKKYGDAEVERIRALDDQSIETMKKYGLQIYKPTPEQEAVFKEKSLNGYQFIRGKVVPGEAIDIAIKARDALRAKKAAE